MSCIKGKGEGGGTAHGRWRVYRRRWIHAGGRGRDVTHARGTVNASAIRQMHETLPPPPLLPSAISSAPNFPDYSSLSRQRYLLHLLLHLLFHQAHACNPPMLNATFASPSIYLHSSNPPHPTPPPPPLMNHRPAPLFPSRSHFLPSYLALSRSRAPLPSPPPLVYVFIVCA